MKVGIIRQIFLPDKFFNASLLPAQPTGLEIICRSVTLSIVSFTQFWSDTLQTVCGVHSDSKHAFIKQLSAKVKIQIPSFLLSYYKWHGIFITWRSTIVKTWTCSKDTWHVTWRSTCLTNPRSSALFWRLRWLHPRKISQILTEAGGKYYPEWDTISPLTWQPRRLLATLFRFSHQTILTAAIESLQSLVPGWRRQMKLNRAKVKTRRCELRMRQQAGTFQTGVWEMRQRENLTGTTHLGQFLLGSNYFIQYFLPQLLTFHGGKSWNMNSY